MGVLDGIPNRFVRVGVRSGECADQRLERQQVRNSIVAE